MITQREDIPLQKWYYRVDDSPFTVLAELEHFVKNQNNKSPELARLQVNDVPDRTRLLDAANVCLANVEMSHHLFQAIVISIYQKNDASLLENYRPISLLDTCYRIIAAFTERLDKGLDSWLMATQFGFRNKKYFTCNVHGAQIAGHFGAI